MTNSVIAQNTAGTSGPDISKTGTPPSFTAGHSFFGTTVAIDTDNGGNINNGGNPHLAALADNGGPVMTRAILADSPLIDAGDNASASGLTNDANDNARLSGLHVDIGATEVQQLVVTTASDVSNPNDGVLSLREAVVMANADPDLNIITFDAGLAGQTITLTGGELGLTHDIVIDGDVNGDDKADITISGNNASRVFNVSGTGTDVELDSLTLTHGRSNVSGAAVNTGFGTTLTVVDTTIADNATGPSGVGGGIASLGTLTVIGSTLSGNTASSGGALWVSGYNQSTTLIDTTIDGNSATYDGAGIEAGNGIHLTLLNSTVTDNDAGRYGGGARLFGTTMTVTNSVIAQNTAGSGGADISKLDSGLYNATVAADHSFFGTTIAIDTDNGGNINNGRDPLLAALADNGGAVETRNILLGSALVDAGDDAAAASLTSDANGNARLSGAHVDIGATEVQQLVVTTAADVVANDGFLSLREAVQMADAGPEADLITFDAGLAGQTITLTGGELALTNDVGIDGDVNGDNKADITISGNNLSRIFNVSGSGTDVQLDSLTLTNGHNTGNGGAIITGGGTTLAIADSTIQDSSSGVSQSGGGIYSGGTLTITGSTLSGNTAGGFGGGVYVVVLQSASFTNTTLYDNHATDDGGGIDTGSGAHLTILNSTITGNYAASDGGGVDLFNGATLTVTNSVIALNTAVATGTDISETGGASSTITAGHSFFGTAVAVDTDNGGNINNGGNPLLAALADNGGPVETRTILLGSALIDRGDDAAASGLATDANGNARLSGPHVDIGAAEVQYLVVTTASDVVDANDGVLSLREAVALANAAPTSTSSPSIRALPARPSP